MGAQPESLVRVMALHALEYCERLFYLEEVEEVRLADDRVYAGRTLHEELRKCEEETGEWTSLEMESQALGLTGKVDCLRKLNGSMIPYEHKKGRCFKKGKERLAWPSDALQVAAYAMLLEERTGKAVQKAKIRYHRDNVTVTINVDEEARMSVKRAIKRAGELKKSLNRPPITDNDRLCIKCSLSPVCLPEEERLLDNREWDPVRLFPADLESKTIHVVTPGAKVSRSGKSLKVKHPDGSDISFPLNEIGSVALHGYAQMTTQALYMCARNGIPTHFISTGGSYVTGLAPTGISVHRRLRQYNALSDSDACGDLAKKLVHSKINAQLRYILRTSRGLDREALEITESIEKMRVALRNVAHGNDLESLRGHEGLAARAYFSGLSKVFREEVPDEMRFSKRTRRPPKDRFNALLGFGYSMLYQSVFQAIMIVGLDPSIGFFHQPRSSAHPLALDLMELFRTALWDIPLMGSVNRLQWDPGKDFEVTTGRVWLSTEGRKKAIQIFERRLSEKWKHPVVNYSLSYSRLIELEVRLLEKEWTGQPGLFGLMKLR